MTNIVPLSFYRPDGDTALDRPVTVSLFEMCRLLHLASIGADYVGRHDEADEFAARRDAAQMRLAASGAEDWVLEQAQ